MGWSNQYHKQQQAKQLRAIERATAAAAGQQPRPLSWHEKHVMGVKDPKGFPALPPGAPVAAPQPMADAARIAYLEGRVAALEARMQWAIDVVQQLHASQPVPSGDGNPQAEPA